MPSPTPTPTAEPDYDSGANIFLLFAGRGHSEESALLALARARENLDKSQVPVIIEMLRFFPAQGLWIEAVNVLKELTGQDFGTEFESWNNWMEWLAPNLAEYQPPKRYLEWKTNMLSLVDPRFEDFLRGATKTARIDLTELAWGGVAVDGIPVLQDPPHVIADGQDYLLPDDRVFGVSINGEHRAYPLRIMNAHEMANDILGGEPIALAY
jgi:hypothetical protein